MNSYVCLKGFFDKTLNPKYLWKIQTLKKIIQVKLLISTKFKCISTKLGIFKKICSDNNKKRMKFSFLLNLNFLEFEIRKQENIAVIQGGINRELSLIFLLLKINTC